MLINNRLGVRQSGFTLVELAVVLAVIGLILGAVMIGLDIQRNAEYTKVKQKFIDQWVVAYNAYYQRTGVPVGDSQIQPQLMVNGESFVEGGNSSGGDLSTEEPLAVICEGDNGVLEGPVDGERSLRTLMLQAGVTLPPGRGEGFEDRYVYLDSNGNPQEIQVCFGWNPPGTLSGSGNVMVITGLTPDLARFLDQAIDGQADAREGLFRQVGLNGDGDGGRNQPGLQWNVDNTFGFDEASGDPGTGRAQNEDQVATVVAHYKMNQ